MGSFLSNPFGNLPNRPMSTKSGVRKFTDYNAQTNDVLSSDTQQQRMGEAGSILPGYQGLIQSGGYSPLEKANIEQGTIGGIQGAYSGASDAASRRMGRTGNPAGYGSFLGSLARNKARDVGQGELQVQSQFADEAYKRKLAGLQGLASLYNIDTSFLNNLQNLQTETGARKDLGLMMRAPTGASTIANIGGIMGILGKAFPAARTAYSYATGKGGDSGGDS